MMFSKAGLPNIVKLILPYFMTHLGKYVPIYW